MSNPRKTTVEPKGSKEFESTKDELPMEVVHAADVLETYFKEQGYDQWLFKGICSRKLLEKVQKRVPNPQYVTVPGHPYNLVQEAVTMTQEVYDRERARMMAGGIGSVHPESALVDFLRNYPQPFTSIEVGTAPTGILEAPQAAEIVRAQQAEEAEF